MKFTLAVNQKKTAQKKQPQCDKNTATLILRKFFPIYYLNKFP